MDRQMIVLLLMMCGGCCLSLPLDGQQATNNTQAAASQVPLSHSNESLVDVNEANNITTNNASLNEDLEIESNVTDGGEGDSLSPSPDQESAFDSQSNSTNSGDGDNQGVTTNNSTSVFSNYFNWLNPFARNDTNGTFGKEGSGGFFVNITNRLNSSSPDVVDRQNLGFGWFSNPANGAFGQSYTNLGYPYGNGQYNGYDLGYPGGYGVPGGGYPGGYGVPGGGYPGGYGAPGGGYGGYPYDGYGYGIGQGYRPPGYEFGDGYGYMNSYPNGYSNGYEYWKRIYGAFDPWYWQTSPRGYWNSVDSWG